jgi:hypothetical protein
MTDSTEISEDTINRLANAIPDLFRDFHDCTVFVTVSDQSECGRAVRIACLNTNEKTSTAKPPKRLLNWVQKTPTFRLGNPHADDDGTLFVDIIPVN